MAGPARLAGNLELQELVFSAGLAPWCHEYSTLVGQERDQLGLWPTGKMVSLSYHHEQEIGGRPRLKTLDTGAPMQPSSAWGKPYV